VLLGAILCNADRAHELHAAYLGHDFYVKSCQLLRRPDMLFAFTEFAVLIECDEHAHRDRKLWSEESHLTVIHDWLIETHELDKLFVLRVNPDGSQPMFKRTIASNQEQVWEPTSHGLEKLPKILAHLKPVFDAGLDNDKDWLTTTFAGSSTNVVTTRLFF
jgi:hypothetical protein